MVPTEGATMDRRTPANARPGSRRALRAHRLRNLVAVGATVALAMGGNLALASTATGAPGALVESSDLESSGTEETTAPPTATSSPEPAGEPVDQETDAPDESVDSGHDAQSAPAPSAEPTGDPGEATDETVQPSEPGPPPAPLATAAEGNAAPAALSAAAPVISDLTVTPQSTTNGDYTTAEVDNNVVMTEYYLPPTHTIRRFAPFVPSATVTNVPADATVLFSFYPGDASFTVPSETVVAEDLDGDGIHLSKWDKDGRDDSPHSASVDFIISGSHPDMVPGDTMRFEVAVVGQYNNVLARTVRSGICFSFCAGDPPETNTFVLDSETTLSTSPGASITCGDTVPHDPRIFPLTLATFCLDVAPGSTHEVTITHATDMRPSELTAKKYDPADGSYAVIDGAVITESGTIGVDHQLTLTYSITDNGVLDQDPTPGQIVDPVGLSATVAFADQSLEDAVNDELGHPHGTPVTMVDASGVTALDATGAGIADLTGIEHLTGLTDLVLDDNSITDVSPLSGMTQLNRIILSSNSVSSLAPLSGMTSLETLSIGRNLIVDISPLSGLTNLKYLYANSNDVADLSPLVGRTGLIHLTLQANDITDVSALSGLTNLTFLSVSENGIADISALSGLTNLTALNLLGQSVTLPAAVPGAVTANPVTDPDGDPVVVSSSDSDFTYEPATGEWTFTDLGAKTMTWSTPVTIAGAADVVFSGEISQLILATPLVPATAQAPDVVQASCVDGDVSGPQIDLPTTDGIDYTVEGDVEPGATVMVRATPADDQHSIVLDPDSDWIGNSDGLDATLEITLASVECDTPLPVDDGDDSQSSTDDSTDPPASTDDETLPSTGLDRSTTVFGALGALALLAGAAFLALRRRPAGKPTSRRG